MKKEKIQPMVFVALILAIFYLAYQYILSFFCPSIYQGSCRYDSFWQTISGIVTFFPFVVTILSVWGRAVNKRAGTLGCKTSFSRITASVLIVLGIIGSLLTIFGLMIALGMKGL